MENDIKFKDMKKTILKAAAVICAAAAAACGQAPVQTGASEYAVITVGTVDRVIPSTYSATIRGRQDIDVLPQVGGTISQLCVTEGETVRAGQQLFIIDQVPYKAALQTAEANVEAAKAQLATAKLVFDSRKELFAKNVVSEYDLRTAENSYLTAKAGLAQAEAQAVNARNNLSYTVVKSPSNGVVGTLPYRVGALVGPSIPQPLTTVSDNSAMYVYFSINESRLLALTREYGSMDKALAAMPDVELVLSDGSTYAEKGRIESVSGVVDRQTGSVQVRAVFPNEGRILHSGSTGNVILPNVRKGCIVVPQGATFEIQDKVYVYKVVDGKAVSEKITVEKISDGREYIVLSGLSVGDVIVGEGVGLMREGTPVKAKGAAGAEEQTAAAVAE